MPDRVLLTGATGFLGSHVAERLRARGHALRCTIRESSDLRWLEGLDLQLVEADLTDDSGLEAAVEDVDAVVHAAGVTRAARNRVFHDVNVEGTRRLAEAAARTARVRRFVFVSSLAARGPDGAGGPASAYGRSKRDAEERLLELAGCRAEASSPMHVVILRPGGIYGPRDTDLLPLFRLASWGWLPVAPSSGRVQPVFVDDVARAVCRALEAPPGPGPWPVAGAGRHRWSDLADGLEDAMGRRVRTVPLPGSILVALGAVAELWGRCRGRPPEFDRRSARDLARHSWTCDPSTTVEALAWRPRVELAEGLRRTARWYRATGWL